LIEKTRAASATAPGSTASKTWRPGIYTVTFTLQGFSTFKREGIELTGSFTATVNADLKVGALSETIPSRAKPQWWMCRARDVR